MTNNDFWDFAAFWEFFNPFGDKDKTFKCPFCGREIEPDEKVEVDKARNVFKCPGCEELLQIEPATGELAEVEEEAEENKKELQPQKEITPFTTGKKLSGERFSFKLADGNVSFYPELIIVDLKARKKDDVFKELVGLYTAYGLVRDGNAFYRSIVETEGLFGSTAIGKSVAMPHGQADDIDEDVIPAIAISKKGLDFGALDGVPTKIIFLTASKTPVIRAMRGVIIKFLAGVSRFVKYPEVRETLINALSREETFQYIKEKFLPLSGIEK